MRFVYKPFSLVFGLISGFLARTAFTKVWERLDDAEPPEPGHREADMRKVLTATVLQSVIFAATTAITQRLSFKAFEHLTGMWAGEKELVPGGPEMDPRYPERRMNAKLPDD